MAKNPYWDEQESEDAAGKVASHYRLKFKSVPATGVRGDQPAGSDWHRLLKDEDLIRTQQRLKA